MPCLYRSIRSAGALRCGVGKMVHNTTCASRKVMLEPVQIRGHPFRRNKRGRCFNGLLRLAGFLFHSFQQYLGGVVRDLKE
jgi:hypothetical protein